MRGRLALGALAPRKAMGYTVQIASGLAAVQEKEIVR